MHVLNELLYRRLRDRFHKVHVVNSGRPANVYYAPDFVYRKGRLKALLSDWGEVYYINCPFCHDTRGRLGISHRWGVRDEKTRDDMLQLVKCHNEDCLCTREKQKQLHALLFPNGALSRGVKVELPAVVVKSRPAKRVFELPGGVNVSKLPENHPAVLYLKDRGFSAERLGKKWHVRFCEGNGGPGPAFDDDRIVYPVYTLQASFLDDDIDTEPRLAGWQARRIDDTADDEPKYLSAAGMRKSELLYGLPAAVKGEGPVVVVEGVTDVWRLRHDAVAMFGKSVSHQQLKLLCRYFAGRPLVVFLDADARKEAKELRRQLLDAREDRGDEAPVVLARPPKGRNDPGDCRFSEAWGAVGAALV